MSRTIAPSYRSFLPSRSLLRGGVSLLSGLAILTSSTVRAQDATESAIDPVSAEPAVVESAPLPEAAPIPEPAVPSVDVAPLESSLQGGESFIDSTQYNIGATQRSSDQAAPPTVRLPQLSPTAVQVGPVAVGSYGVTAPTTPSLQDYYYRTLRPPARLGNGNIRLIFPLSIPAPITSLFGWRIHPITGAQSFHMGTDIGAPLGTPVLAAYAGQVAIADFLGGYGLAVALEHNKGTQQTLYGHLSEIFVKPGETVKQGEVIGRVGSTGNSTGPHLHFEFHQKTAEGWVALDAGEQLEYALGQLVKTMGLAQVPTAPTAPTVQLDLSATVDVNLQERS